MKRSVIRVLDELVNLIVLMIVLILGGYGVYTLWDDRQIYQSADMENYETWRPEEDNDLSFRELQAINPEVIGWLTVYGTKIDYPFAQANNNTKYVNTDITGEFALSGSLFLDCRNAADFTDLNHVIYGHHMEKKTMLGELECFAERPFFEEHRYGRLYYNGQDHGLEFIAFLETDAYDDMIYNVTLTEDEQEKYLSCLREKAMYYRETELSAKEHFLTLSTCDSGRTNGRYVLVGRIIKKGSGNVKIEIKKLILCAAVSLILLPAEEVLGAEQMASVMIPVVQKFETRNKLPDKMNQTFRYELLREEQDAPMPDESDGDRYVFDMKGSEKNEVGPITYTRAGIWHYTLKQSVQKEEKGYDYDKQTYEISVYVENLTDGGLGVQMIVVNKEGNKVDEIRFKNGYTGEKTGNVARTGDVSDIGLWIILLAVSGVVAGKAVHKKRPA